MKRFERQEFYNEPDDLPKLIGIFVDTETTGINYKTDKIIEIALVPFEYTNDGKIYKVLESYSSLQGPNTQISSFITSLTGITT